MYFLLKWWKAHNTAGLVRLYVCTLCDIELAEKKLFVKTYAAFHDKEIPFECKICGAKFAEIGTLNTHITSLHDGKKPYKCSICDAKFSQRAHVKTHIASIHEFNPIPHGLCEIRYYMGAGTLCPHLLWTFITQLISHLAIKTWFQTRILVFIFP